MTVSELREALSEYPADEEVDLSLIIDDLCDVVAAVEQFCEVAEVFGRYPGRGLENFIAQAGASL
jgi:hypothetical protein